MQMQPTTPLKSPTPHPPPTDSLRCFKEAGHNAWIRSYRCGIESL